MFNPQGRWDRSLPGDLPSSGWEPVEVVARFSRGRIIPLSFILAAAPTERLRLLYSWTERSGTAKMYYFSVCDRQDNYVLRFDSEAMSWRLRAA